MRPERPIVKKAIEDAGGNLSKAAGILGATRQSLYTWIYQYGLERKAGIRMDTRTQLDTRDRQDTRPRKENKTGVYSAGNSPSNLLLVTTPATAQDYPIQASFKVRESLWKRVKIEAIRRGCTVGEMMDAVLETTLTEQQKKERKG